MLRAHSFLHAAVVAGALVWTHAALAQAPAPERARQLSPWQVGFDLLAPV